MIILKHIKQGDVSFVSHRDTLKALQRGLKRAKINVEYSQGYIPHMLTYATSPMPLGTQSTAEYFAVACDGVTPQQFLERYNKSVPTGLKGLTAIYKEKNPNLVANISASDYVIKYKEKLPLEIMEILKKDKYEIVLNRVGGDETRDVRQLIFDLKVEDSTLFMRLATGNPNLRVDSFVKSINAQFGLDMLMNDVFRVGQLVRQNEKFITVEEFLQ